MTPLFIFFVFFFNDTATTEIYTTTDTLSLHDALPIYHGVSGREVEAELVLVGGRVGARVLRAGKLGPGPLRRAPLRGERHRAGGAVRDGVRQVDVVAQVGEPAEHEAVIGVHPRRVERAIERVGLAAPRTRGVDGIDLVSAVAVRREEDAAVGRAAGLVVAPIAVGE